MSDNKINIEGLNASMDDFFKQFNPGQIVEKSPALKINTDVENKLFVVGFDIISVTLGTNIPLYVYCELDSLFTTTSDESNNLIKLFIITT